MPSPMKRNPPSRDTSSPPVESAPPRVSLRALYADAMKEVMSDPRKAVAQHDPCLAALLAVAPDAPAA